MTLLPERVAISATRRRRLQRLFELTRARPPRDLAGIVRDELRVDLAGRYGDRDISHPFGKASGQLSTTLAQVEADVEAGIAFTVLKTVIAEDRAGQQSMSAWTLRETRMKVERRTASGGREGWTVTWKGRGWHGSFSEYLEFFAASLKVAGENIPVVPSVKYHLPLGDEPFRVGEYEHTTRALLDVWSRARAGAGPMLLEKDFSPTLAGDDRARQRATILRWLSDVPGMIEIAAPGKTRLGLKLMNALFDDAFQVEMTRLAAASHPAFIVGFNRLFDPDRKVAYGGFDLSDRNLRVLDAVRADPHGTLPPLSATGNICSGRMMTEYALRGAENGQVHTFFQLPLAEYTASGGSRTARGLHTLLLHPDEGLVAWLWHLNEAGSLEERKGVVHFLDVPGR